jgi:hypothetical protein
MLGPRLIAVQMVAALLVTALAVAACGVRGDPEPPPGRPEAEAVPFPDRPAPNVEEEDDEIFDPI